METTDNLHPPSTSPGTAKNSKNIIVIVFGILLLAVLVLYGVFSSGLLSSGKKSTSEKSEEPKNVFLAPATIVYGAWSADASNIYAYDLSSSKDGKIAELPANIKKVIPISGDSLIFVNNTDTRDHGTELAAYSISSKKITSSYKAADGFLIDDYVISPNKQYIAVWEVQVDKDSGVLLGGRSRVYTALLSSSSSKNLVYDEISDKSHPVHYPRAILDNGRVFMDSFMPNSGAGWAYGMSVADFNGSNKEDIPGMQNGQYGTQPNLSPDGKFLAYGAYNGSKGDGAVAKNGYRQALLTPNVVERLDTNTLERIQIVGLQSSNIYPEVRWGNDSDTLILSIIGPTDGQSGTYSFNLTTNVPKKIDSATDETIIAELSDGYQLHGKADFSSSALGNLGENYSTPYTSMSAVNPSVPSSIPLSLSTNYAQFIGIMPSQTYSLLTGSTTKSKQNLQLQAFYFKTQLAPTREAQNSAPSAEKCKGNLWDLIASECPRCRDLFQQQCTLSGNNSPICVRTIPNGSQCWDSPLYLYGPEGTKITVKIWTQVSNSTPENADGYDVTLGQGGKFSVNGNSYSSIDYDYKPAIKKLPVLTKGKVVKVSNLEQIVKEYAEKLNLNFQEAEDLIARVKQLVSGPYIFVSFFDHETSHAILPITFDPKPDVYRNIVFYFKNLDKAPQYSVEEPVFERIIRRGFSAIEISEIVE